MSNTTNADVRRTEEQVSSAAIAIAVLALTWVVLCVYSVARAIACTSRTGTPRQKVAGIVLAALFGPFYFLYAPNGYCGSCPSGYTFVAPDPNQQRIEVAKGVTPPWCQPAGRV